MKAPPVPDSPLSLESLKQADHLCPSCAAEAMSVFHRVPAIPVHSTLNMKTEEVAVHYPRGSIALGFCRGCGFISNVEFDPALIQYSPQFEETQGFSPTFNAFARRQAAELIERYDLHSKDIIEIGCGKGQFLTLLCELGHNRGVGFDPAYVKDRDLSPARDRITFINDYYSEKYTHYQADFICCRMTLEHIPDVGNFVKMVRRSIGERDTLVFFQVPDVIRIVKDCCFEDIYYEHCSYFSGDSLAALFFRSGFDVLAVHRAYDGQYLTLEARPCGEGSKAPLPLDGDLEFLQSQVVTFAERLGSKAKLWRSRFADFQASGKRVVLWGSGSKAVAFTTCLGLRDEIGYTVDINPYRQGTYLPGTGHYIVPPAFLKDYRPHVVIIMNAVYLNEIREELDSLQLAPEILTV